MRQDSPRAHNCRAHESGVSAAYHNLCDTPDDTLIIASEDAAIFEPTGDR